MNLLKQPLRHLAASSVLFLDRGRDAAFFLPPVC